VALTFDVSHQGLNVPGSIRQLLFRLQGGCDGAALFVAQNNDQGRLEVLHRVKEAGASECIDGVAGKADDEAGYYWWRGKR